MSQASPQRSAKNLAAAFYAVADEIDEMHRLPIVLAAVGQIVSDARMLLRAPRAVRQPDAKASRMKKAGARAGKPAPIAAEAAAAVEGATVAAAPAATGIAKRRGRPPAKMKRPMPRASATAAGNGASAAA